MNKGIGVFDIQSGTFDFSQHQNQLLDVDFVRSVYSNDQGEFWAGSDKYGLFYLRPETRNIHIHRFESTVPERPQINMRDIHHLGNEQYLLTFFKYPEVWIWNRMEDTYEHIAFDNTFRYAYCILQYA